MYSEKRNRERIRRKNRVSVWPYSAVQPSRLLVQTDAVLEDVGLDGICAIIDTELVPGARARVVVELEPGNITTARARQFKSDVEVMWSTPMHEEGPYKTGLRFFQTSKADLQVWSDFIGKSRASLF